MPTFLGREYWKSPPAAYLPPGRAHMLFRTHHSPKRLRPFLRAVVLSVFNCSFWAAMRSRGWGISPRIWRTADRLPGELSHTHHKCGSLASLGRDSDYLPPTLSLYFVRVPPSHYKDTHYLQGLNENTHDMIWHTSQLASVWSEYERGKLCGIAQIAWVRKGWDTRYFVKSLLFNLYCACLTL